MSREGGPESAFRLAGALEGAGVVVMDAGAGLIGTKVLSVVGNMRSIRKRSALYFYLFICTASCLRPTYE